MIDTYSNALLCEVHEAKTGAPMLIRVDAITGATTDAEGRAILSVRHAGATVSAPLRVLETWQELRGLLAGSVGVMDLAKVAELRDERAHRDRVNERLDELQRLDAEIDTALAELAEAEGKAPSKRRKGRRQISGPGLAKPIAEATGGMVPAEEPSPG